MGFWGFGVLQPHGELLLRLRCHLWQAPGGPRDGASWDIQRSSPMVEQRPVCGQHQAAAGVNPGGTRLALYTLPTSGITYRRNVQVRATTVQSPHFLCSWVLSFHSCEHSHLPDSSYGFRIGPRHPGVASVWLGSGTLAVREPILSGLLPWTVIGGAHNRPELCHLG